MAKVDQSFIFNDRKSIDCCFFVELILTITETWGDPNYCGLTGIEVVDINDADCVIHSYDARPRDVTVLPSNSGDARILDKYLSFSIQSNISISYPSISVYSMVKMLLATIVICGYVHLLARKKIEL